MRDMDFVLQLWSFLVREPVVDRPALKARVCIAMDEGGLAWLKTFLKALEGGADHNALVNQAIGVSIVRSATSRRVAKVLH